ncbi:MAG TPA: oligosaccharide flippase family protein [Bryobacteraceae bacterium]|jgi:O-antigen/teichoic acid export membrane protein|nr:oligosaccharide flippase family protein [Bryobacteraceae bacterium]
MKSLRGVLNNSLARNAGWMFVGQGLTFFIQAASFVLLARMLGNIQYGIFAGAFALVSNLSPYTTLGSGMVFLRHVSANRTSFREYWANILLSTFLAGTTLVVVSMRLGHWLLDAKSAAIIGLIAIGECLCGRLVECAGQVFQAHEMLRVTATLNTIVNLFRFALIATLFVTFRHIDVRTWAIASLCVSALALAVAVAVVTKRFGTPHFDLRLFGTKVLEGLGFSVSASTISVYNDVDKTVLSHYRMAAANGVYTIAYRAIDIGTIPIYSIYSATLPRAFKLGRNGITNVLPLGLKVLRRAALFGGLAAIGMAAFAPVAPYFLGNTFVQSVSAIRWLCLIPLLRSLHLSAGLVLTGSGRHKYRTIAQVVAAAFNIGINLFLIPRYSWIGAAWASLLTDGSLAVMNWCLVGYFSRQITNTALPAVASESSDQIAA